MRSVRGISIVDVLVATVVMSVALIPMLSMSSRGVQRLGVDRVAVEAEQLCHDMLERFGRAPDNVAVYLDEVDQQGRRSAVNPWEKHATLAAELGAERIARLASRNGLAMELSTTPVAVGLDRLSCVVTWVSGEGRERKTRRVEYSRLVLQEQVRPWS